MAFFGLSEEEFNEIIKNTETRIIARINQVETRVEKLTEKLEKIELILESFKIIAEDTEDIKRKIEDIKKTKKNRNSKRNKRGRERNSKLFKFLKVPHSTAEVKDKFNYSRSYTSYLLNNLQKKGKLKISKRVGNVPYYQVKEEK